MACFILHINFKNQLFYIDYFDNFSHSNIVDLLIIFNLLK